MRNTYNIEPYTPLDNDQNEAFGNFVYEQVRLGYKLHRPEDAEVEALHPDKAGSDHQVIYQVPDSNSLRRLVAFGLPESQNPSSLTVSAHYATYGKNGAWELNLRLLVDIEGSHFSHADGPTVETAKRRSLGAAGLRTVALDGYSYRATTGITAKHAAGITVLKPSKKTVSDAQGRAVEAFIDDPAAQVLPYAIGSDGVFERALSPAEEFDHPNRYCKLVGAAELRALARLLVGSPVI